MRIPEQWALAIVSCTNPSYLDLVFWIEEGGGMVRVASVVALAWLCSIAVRVSGDPDALFDQHR